MRWVSPFIHQPGEHGCQRRAETKWESSPSSVFALHTHFRLCRFPTLVRWLWNSWKSARWPPSLFRFPQIKSQLLLKSIAFRSRNSTFSWKLPSKVETLNLCEPEFQLNSNYISFESIHAITFYYATFTSVNLPWTLLIFSSVFSVEVQCKVIKWCI